MEDMLKTGGHAKRKGLGKKKVVRAEGSYRGREGQMGRAARLEMEAEN